MRKNNLISKKISRSCSPDKETLTAYTTLPMLKVFTTESSAPLSSIVSPQAANRISPSFNSIPRLNYFSFKTRHSLKKVSACSRFESDSPQPDRNLDHPHTLKYPSRSFVQIFNRGPAKPIGRLSKFSNKASYLSDLKKHFNPNKALSLSKKQQSSNLNIKPAITYGEKLCRLFELSSGYTGIRLKP